MPKIQHSETPMNSIATTNSSDHREVAVYCMFYDFGEVGHLLSFMYHFL